jgi:hypothetical protein
MFGHQNPWIRIGFQHKMLDPDPYPYQINTDPQPWKEEMKTWEIRQ